MPTRSPATISEAVKLEHGVSLEDVKTEGTDETEDMTEVKAPDLPPPMPLGPDDGHPPAEAAAAFPPPIAQDQQHLPLPNGFGYTAPNHPHDGGIAVLLEGAAGTEAMGENAAADGMAAMPGLPPVGAVAAMPHIPLPHMYPRNIGMPEVIIPAKWLSRYEELKRYKQHHGDTNVPQKYETNPQLGAWCRTQKQQMKLLQEGKPTHMSQARLELLNEIGFEFTGEKRDKFWSERYRELVDFHAKNNGSTRVPDKYDAAPQLNSWVALQRLQLKKYKEGKKSKLSPDRVAMLESLGLEYRIRNTCTWMERFLELKEYKEQQGNCNVPQKFKTNPSLGRWVDNQKTQHKKLYEGKATHLTIERIQLLVGLGFSWR